MILKSLLCYYSCFCYEVAKDASLGLKPQVSDTYSCKPQRGETRFINSYRPFRALALILCLYQGLKPLAAFFRPLGAKAKKILISAKVHPKYPVHLAKCFSFLNNAESQAVSMGVSI